MDGQDRTLSEKIDDAKRRTSELAVRIAADTSWNEDETTRLLLARSRHDSQLRDDLVKAAASGIAMTVCRDAQERASIQSITRTTH